MLIFLGANSRYEQTGTMQFEAKYSMTVYRYDSAINREKHLSLFKWSVLIL